MDCICTSRSRITTQNKYYWIIEGDIKGCFDHIHHAILLKLVKRRIRDPRILALIAAMLKAGVMDGRLFQHTPEGTPQGGILSHLLANIYLHEFDRWWWEPYEQLTLYQKQKRRKAGVGNCILTRYADDFVLLCNGRVRQALRVIWGERAEAIEQEGYEILGVRALREYFRKPALFFADHLQRYSKSRRQAPIYWPLSTSAGSSRSGCTTTA